jgi:putative transposase
MLITPLPPALVAGKRFGHGSILDGKIRPSRVSSQWKSTIYRQLGLQLRNKTPKRRVKAKLRDDRRAATEPNETWAMDFVHDQLATGRKIRILTVVDTFTRVSPVIDPRFSYLAENVIEALDRACVGSGYP